MNLLSERVEKIIRNMEGKPYGKQVALADIAGASKQVVNHWTTGVTLTMDYDYAKRISEKLGYRVDWLMSGKGPERVEQPDDVQPMREQQAQNVSSSTKPANDLFLTHVTYEEMRLLTFCRTYPEAAKTFYKMAAGLTGHPAMK